MQVPTAVGTGRMARRGHRWPRRRLECDRSRQSKRKCRRSWV